MSEAHALSNIVRGRYCNEVNIHVLKQMWQYLLFAVSLSWMYIFDLLCRLAINTSILEGDLHSLLI